MKISGITYVSRKKRKLRKIILLIVVVILVFLAAYMLLERFASFDLYGRIQETIEKLSEHLPF